MQTTIKKNYSTLENLLEDIRKSKQTTSNYTAFIEMREYVRQNKTHIIDIISSKNLKELKKFFTHTSSWHTRETLTSAIYEHLLDLFILDSTPREYDQSQEDLREARLNSQTEEEYNVWIDKKVKAHAKLKKAINNPETIEEFKTFILHKGESKLTSQQLATFDQLRADSNNEQRKRNFHANAQIKAVDIPENLTFNIVESHHTTKKIPLWVVILSQRIDEKKFDELKSKANKLDGYYSSYNKNGAIPGFTFKTLETATLFANLKDTDADASSIQEALNKKRTENRVISLKEKSNTMLEEATLSFNQERLANTNRRARFAAAAELEAIRRIEFAKILIQIAEAIENGGIKYLHKMAHITELETLLNILVNAKWRHIRLQNLNSEAYDLTTATADFATFPYPVLYKDDFGSIERLKNSKGKKMAAARTLKKLKTCNEYIKINTPSDLSDYETLFCTPCKELSSFSVAQYKEELMKLKRIIRLDLEKIFELRAALRELITIKNSINLTPEEKKLQQIRELDRSFLHRKIPGFFPTPPQLAEENVELAEIEDHHTICEPSAGLGHLAEVIANKHPDNFLQCVEINHALGEALKLKGFETEIGDFLQHTKTYDRIILNPPFENLQDIDHVIHAFKLLNPRGRLVATMANNKQGNNPKIKPFIELVNQHGSMKKNPENSFASAFRPTGVSTITVVLNKP